MQTKRNSEKKIEREIRLQTMRTNDRLRRKSETEVSRHERLQRKKGSRRSRNKGKSINELISKFHQVIVEGPTYVCICCDQLWYKHSVEKGKALSD